MSLLIDTYRSEISNLTAKEREPVRARWNQAARRYLILMSVTSDQVVDARPDANGVTTIPFAQMWLQRTRGELEALYRETAPTRRGAKRKVVKP